MPLGFERLNERSQRPNTLINFIKPSEGPDKAVAQDFLEHIAAQCYPVMKAAHISVMSLEEFPPNNEFLGRNFNAGECVQLVLKDKSGRWLGFKYVQMVMMHELAHCKQMNHSKFFWQVRNRYAEEMYSLWAKKYLGEGIWGRGRDLTSGSFVMDRDITAGDVPEHLCGGTYRRRGRKRRKGASDASEGQRPTYAERQQKRIAKKFGKHGDGNALGEDELIRGAYEQGNRHQGKPRVANSKRGRELRAQAALARFGAPKPQVPDDSAKSDATDDSDIEWSDSETEDEAVVVENGFVKVCEGEEHDDEDANNEMHELLAVGESKSLQKSKICDEGTQSHNKTISKAPADTKSEPGMVESSTKGPDVVDLDDSSTEDEVSTKTVAAKDASQTTTSDTATIQLPHQSESKAISSVCPICSLENDPASLSCLACAHVLKPRLVRNTWHCQSSTCRGSAYLNAGDSGRCGICGTARPVATAASRPAGPISADVLRWD